MRRFFVTKLLIGLPLSEYQVKCIEYYLIAARWMIAKS